MLQISDKISPSFLARVIAQSSPQQVGLIDGVHYNGRLQPEVKESLGAKASVGLPLTDVGSRDVDCKFKQKVGANFITHNNGASFQAPITRRLLSEAPNGNSFVLALVELDPGLRIKPWTRTEKTVPPFHPAGVLLPIQTLRRA